MDAFYLSNLTDYPFIKDKYLQKSRGPVLGTVVKIHKENLNVIANRIGANLQISPGSVTLLDMQASTLLQDLRQRILISLE